MISKAIPVLNCNNIYETDKFYRTHLDFSTINYGNYLVVKKAAVEIHFILHANTNEISGCCFFDNNIEDTFTKFCSMDIIFPEKGLFINAIGKKEFCFNDNSNNFIRIMEP